MRTLINTVFVGDVNLLAAYKLSPDKIILLVPKNLGKNAKLIITKAIKKTKETFTKLKVKVEIIKTSVYDIREIICDVMEVIDKEYRLGNEVLLHISEGRKVQSFACILAAYKRRNKVAACYYLIEETGQALELPLLDFTLSRSKIGILKELNRGERNMNTIAKNLKISKALVYRLLKELKQESFIRKEENELTDAGRIAIL